MRSKIRLEFAENPAMREVFGRKQPGDECEITIKMTLAKSDENGVEGDITSLEVEDYGGPTEVAEEGEEGESEITPTEAEPVVVSVLRGARRAPAEIPA